MFLSCLPLKIGSKAFSCILLFSEPLPSELYRFDGVGVTSQGAGRLPVGHIRWRPLYELGMSAKDFVVVKPEEGRDQDRTESGASRASAFLLSQTTPWRIVIVFWDSNPPLVIFPYCLSSGPECGDGLVVERRIRSGVYMFSEFRKPLRTGVGSPCLSSLVSVGFRGGCRSMKGFREATEVRKQEGGEPFPLIHWYGSKYLA